MESPIIGFVAIGIIIFELYYSKDKTKFKKAFNNKILCLILQYIPNFESVSNFRITCKSMKDACDVMKNNYYYSKNQMPQFYIERYHSGIGKLYRTIDIANKQLYWKPINPPVYKFMKYRDITNRRY